MVLARNLLRRHCDAYGFLPIAASASAATDFDDDGRAGPGPKSASHAMRPGPMAQEDSNRGEAPPRDQERHRQVLQVGTSGNNNSNNSGSSNNNNTTSKDWLQLGLAPARGPPPPPPPPPPARGPRRMQSPAPPTSFLRPPVAGIASTSVPVPPGGLLLWPAMSPAPPPAPPRAVVQYHAGWCAPGTSADAAMRVVLPPPAAGIWFLLQAAQNQRREPFLPQIPKSYLRIKDGRVTVRLLIMYLVNKLGLEDESEVEITCRGRLLLPFLTLQHVRDSIWCPRDTVLVPPDSSTANHVMTLQYGRRP